MNVSRVISVPIIRDLMWLDTLNVSYVELVVKHLHGVLRLTCLNSPVKHQWKSKARHDKCLTPPSHKYKFCAGIYRGHSSYLSHEIPNDWDRGGSQNVKFHLIIW